MWAKIEVWHYGSWIGSFHEHRDNLLTRADIIKAVNKEFGYGNWDKWTLEY